MNDENPAPKGAPQADLHQQYKQLRELHASGALSDDAFAQGRATLERRAADAGISLTVPDTTAPDVAAPLPVAATPTRPPLRLSAALLAGVFVLAGAGYWWTGPTRQAQMRAEAAAAESAEPAEADNANGAAEGQPQVSRAQIEEMVAKLATRLKDQPDDAEGWSMLARSQMVLGRASDAVAAYKEATQRRPDDASLLVDYANALAMANDRQLSDDAVALLDRALKLDPKSLKGLAMSGSAAYARKDFAGAVRHWENLLALLPADHPLTPQVQASIAEARSAGGLPAAAPSAQAGASGTANTSANASPNTGDTAAGNAPAAAGASVSGTVTLAPALAAKAAPEDTVFIVARAIDGQGPRMPLAILRKQVRDLPITFTLDDSLAMSPAAKISGAPRVTVVARISKSGDAMPRAGDLTGQSAPVAVGTSGLAVEIAQEVAQ